MRDVAVIYLFRFAEGESPVSRFLESYSKYPAGIDHDFYVVFKGFPDQAALAAGRALFANVPFTPIELDDSGYDLGSYLNAAKIVSNSHLIFLNTFSQICGENWLGYFDGALRIPDIGLVGATGSWQANTSSYEAAIVNLLRYEWRLQSARILPPSWVERLRVDRAGELNIHRRNHKLTSRRVVPALIDYARRFYEYGRFPNSAHSYECFYDRKEAILVSQISSVCLKAGCLQI